MARVAECYESRDLVVDKNGRTTECEIMFFAFEVGSEEEALSAVLHSAGSEIEGLALEGAEVQEKINAQTYKIRVIYKRASGGSSGSGGGGDLGNLDPAFTFEIGGGRVRRLQSIKTVAKYPADTAPDFGGAIGVDEEGNINGVEVTTPVFNFTEKHFFKPRYVTTQYKRTLADIYGKVNDSKFKGYEPGEVLFLGASSNRNGDGPEDEYEITFKFAVSPNEKNLKFGDLTVETKRGWDYLWFRYEDTVNEAQITVKKPVHAYVEQVYETRDFGKLGIGV